MDTELRSQAVESPANESGLSESRADESRDGTVVNARTTDKQAKDGRMTDHQATDGQARDSQAASAPASQAPDLNLLLSADARLQSQFDRLLSKALGTARGNWERELNERTAAAEAARKVELEGELERREAELKKRELRADASALLAARELPSELLDLVDASDADTLEGSVARLERAFGASVERALKARLAGYPPKGGGEIARPDMQLRRAMGLKTE